MSAQNVEAVSRIYEAIARRDIPAFLGALDPAVELSSPETLPYGGTYHGPQEVGEKYFAGFLQHVDDDFELIADEYLDAGDTVIAIGRLRGRARQSGASFEVASFMVWTLQGGKVIRQRYMLDTAEVLKALRAEAVA
jgi:ketosteroid isomerase-like protein